MKRMTFMAAALVKSRSVKALSVDQIAQYLRGGAMGNSKPAEVNHFPAPDHVLQMAHELALTAHQIAATHELVEYRFRHLEMHRRMRLLLRDEQIRRYAALRGLEPIPAPSAGHR